MDNYNIPLKSHQCSIQHNMSWIILLSNFAHLYFAIAPPADYVPPLRFQVDSETGHLE